MSEQKIIRSQEYITQLRERFPGYHPEHHSSSVSPTVLSKEAIAGLVDLLDELAQPKVEIPEKFNKNIILRHQCVQRVVLKVWNMIDGPNRRKFHRLAVYFREMSENT